MKILITALALLAAGSVQAAGAPAGLSPEAELVRSLAARPIGVVVGDKCEVRGAVWERGPKAGMDMALINIKTGQTVFARTNEQGVYSASLPYNGVPQIYQERIASRLIVKKGVPVRILDGGVVCDHRLQTRTAQLEEAK